MEYVITEDTKACLQCAQLFEAKRSDTKFCSKECNNKWQALPVEKRYLNPPIVLRSPLKHGDLYTSDEEMALSTGILRVRRRYEDPLVKKAEQDKKFIPGSEDKVRQNGQKELPKRRGA